jgi:hypothetical protein
MLSKLNTTSGGNRVGMGGSWAHPKIIENYYYTHSILI